jgi:hypothetical protein
LLDCNQLKLNLQRVYTPILLFHSWLRWVTLLLAVGATLNAIRKDTDLSRKPPGRQWDTFFMMALDIQVIAGLMLYFRLSPFSTAGLNHLGLAMQDPALFFWTFVHAGVMFSANVVIRVGRVLAINAKTSEARRLYRLGAFALTTVVIIAGIPWPGSSIARPLFRY